MCFPPRFDNLAAKYAVLSEADLAQGLFDAGARCLGMGAVFAAGAAGVERG